MNDKLIEAADRAFLEHGGDASQQAVTFALEAALEALNAEDVEEFAPQAFREIRANLLSEVLPSTPSLLREELAAGRTFLDLGMEAG